MSSVLITGAAGYIGSVATQLLLERGHCVVGYDRLLFGGNGLLGVFEHPDFSFIRGDIRDTNLLNRTAQKVDVIVNLAALVGEPACNLNPVETKQVNDLAVKELGGLNKRIIIASTCSNYGINENELATEETPVNPVSLYSETKCAAEQYIKDTGIVLRFATAYGLSPRMRFDLLLNEWVKDAMTKNYISVYGANSYRPFVHVQDAARAIVFFVENKLPNGIYNIGGQNCKKSELAEMIATPETKVALAEGKQDPRNYRVSFDKINNAGWYSQYSLVGGIEKMKRAIASGIIHDIYSGIYSNV